MNGAVAGVDWDAGNWPRCGKQGVSRAEIEAVLSGTPLVRPDRFPADTEARFDAVGVSDKGRDVFIVCAIRVKNGQRFLRPTSARYMHRKKIDHYERQKGKGP